MSNTPSPRLCVACAAELHETAKSCPNCHTDQRKIVRNIKRVVTVFSGISVVFGVITIAISLYPNAIRILFPNQKIDLYELKTHYVGKEELLEMTVINTGNIDLFLNKVVFEPIDKEKYPLKRRFVTNKWVKHGEAFIHRGKAITAVNFKHYFTPMNAERFLESYRDLEGFNKHKYCFRMVALDNEFDDTGRIPVKLSTIPIKATLFYSSIDRRKVEKFMSSKDLKGQIFLRESSSCKDWVKNSTQS